MAPQGGPERDVLDRLLVQVPALAGPIAGGFRRIPPGSSFRRRFVNLQVKRAFSAMARSDVEVLLLGYEPDAEVWMKTMSGVGISDCYRGHDGIRTLYSDLDDAFADWAWSVRAVADGGDCIAVRGAFVGYGRSSGVQTAVNDGGTAIKLSARAWSRGRNGSPSRTGGRRPSRPLGLRD